MFRIVLVFEMESVWSKITIEIICHHYNVIKISGFNLDLVTVVFSITISKGVYISFVKVYYIVNIIGASLAPIRVDSLVPILNGILRVC